MTRDFPTLFRLSAAALALAGAMPAAGQSFSLPEPSPTPTPTPEGPADERAGVAIPPRPAPLPTPEPAPASTPTPRGIPSAAPSPAIQLPVPSPRPASTPTPRAATPTPAPTPTASATPPVAPPPAPVLPDTSTPADAPPASVSLPDPVAPAGTIEPSDPLGAALFDWRWLAAAAALVAGLLGAILLWRRRRPAILRLAAPAERDGFDAQPTQPRIDLSLEITGATRSMMMFTLHYRLVLANRSERAVSDLVVAVQLACAQRGASNAAPLAAARGLGRVERVERIGPHQSRSIAGEVQMPLAAITPVMQGTTPLFIPLVHVTLEGAGQQALARSFVVGPPSGGAEGRVQPLSLDMPPGSLPGLAARPITAPTA